MFHCCIDWIKYRYGFLFYEHKCIKKSTNLILPHTYQLITQRNVKRICMKSSAFPNVFRRLSFCRECRRNPLDKTVKKIALFLNELSTSLISPLISTSTWGVTFLFQPTIILFISTNLTKLPHITKQILNRNSHCRCIIRKKK